MLPCLCSRKSLSSISSMPCQSSNLVSIPRIRNQLFPQSYDSCFQYFVPLRLLPLFRLSRLHLVLASISSTSSLQYRRCTLQSVSFVLPPFPPHFRRQFSTFITSPSSMYPRTPFASTFNTSRFPLGSLPVPSRCPLVLFTFLNVVSYVPESPTPTSA